MSYIFYKTCWYSNVFYMLSISNYISKSAAAHSRHRARPPPPFLSDSTFVEEIVWRNISTKIRNIWQTYPQNHTQHSQTIMKNRAPWLQKSWKMRSGRRFGGDAFPKWSQKPKVLLECVPKGSFWESFWEQCSIKIRIFRHRFLHQILECIFKGFLWMLELMFVTFGLQNRSRIRKCKHMKNLCFA